MDHQSQAAWRTFARTRHRSWGRDAVLEFQDKTKSTLFYVPDGWSATAAAEGLYEIAVLEQPGVSETVLRDSLRFVVMGGRRFEKKKYDFRVQAPRQHRLVVAHIGEIVP